MTFDDDHVVFRTESGQYRAFLRNLSLEWPPPERLELLGLDYVRARMSTITDEQRQGMTRVARGAEYVPAPHSAVDGRAEHE